MNTIMAYLENMFNGLPKTAEINRIKQDLLAGMEEKYYELKSQGKSENEAVGIVISEFGNIDEITAELGILPHKEDLQVPELTKENVYDYMQAMRLNGMWTGVGVFLILLGVAFLISIVSLFEQLNVFNLTSGFGDIIGLIGMFVFIAIAVSIFIFQGMKFQRFDYLKNGFTLNYLLKVEIKSKQSSFTSTYRTSIIIGVCIAVLSPIIIFLTSIMKEEYTPYTVSAFLLTIAAATYIFIYYGTIQSSYTKLLTEQSEENKEKDKITEVVLSIVWTLAVALFLFTGFVYDSWDNNWVIFVMTGLLSGIVASVVSLFKGKKNT